MGLGSIHAATSGVLAALKKLNVRSHNVANVSTPGFKAKRADAVDLAGGGVRIGGISANGSIGVLMSSQGAFALAINGPGYFAVDDGHGGLAFTRDGSFTTDVEGFLTTSSGHRLLPPTQVPMEAQSVTVSPDGVVSAVDALGQSQTIGQIRLARFTNPDGLAAIGGNLVEPTLASGEPVIGSPGADGMGLIVSGYVESSNVDLAEEMIGMLIDKHSVKANLNVIKTQDELLGDLLDLKS